MGERIRLVTSLDLLPEAIGKLIFHGCFIFRLEKYNLILLPEGAERREVWPRTISERYHIFMPDGYQFREQYDTLLEQSILYLP